MDGDCIVPSQGVRADLHEGDGEVLAWPNGTLSYSVNGGRGVHENGVPMAAPLSLVEDAQSLVYGIGFFCYLLFITRYMGPEGPWQRGRPAAEATGRAAGFFK